MSTLTDRHRPRHRGTAIDRVYVTSSGEVIAEFSASSDRKARRRAKSIRGISVPVTLIAPGTYVTVITGGPS